MPLASPGRRLIAFVVDCLVGGLVISPLVLVTELTIDYDDPDLVLMNALFVATELIAFVWLVGFDGGERGATPGKRLLRIRVADAAAGGPIGYRRAAVRRVAYFFGGLLLFLGWLWLIVDRRHQALHDKIARTVVVEDGTG